MTSLLLALHLAVEIPAVPVDTEAVVEAVQVTGSPGAYTFAVTLRSPDLDCSRYASWWEVVRADGTLLYRRILAHSHKDEQPFTRSGGAVAIPPDEEVIVRAHLHPSGYGTRAMKGTVRGGFAATTLSVGWAKELAGAAPQPDGCLY